MAIGRSSALPEPTTDAATSGSGLIRLAAEWESQQEVYRPERSAGLAALVGAASIAPDEHRLLVDLACGTGSVTSRVLNRYPESRVLGIDRDPVLLAVAGAVFGDDPRVTLQRVDIGEGEWQECLLEPPRAILTAAAVHWLDEATVRSLYRTLADVLRSGAVFANLDWFPLAGAPTLAAFSERVVRDREAQQLDAGSGMSWADWWSLLARQNEFEGAFAEREALKLARSAEFIQPAEWHDRELRQAGFSETAVVWRSFDSAVLVAVR